MYRMQKVSSFKLGLARYPLWAFCWKGILYYEVWISKYIQCGLLKLVRVTNDGQRDFSGFFGGVFVRVLVNNFEASWEELCLMSSLSVFECLLAN